MDEGFGPLFQDIPFYAAEPPVRPFSVLDARTREWRERRKEWVSLGLNEISTRESVKTGIKLLCDKIRISKGGSVSEGDGSGVSVFDPVLCEVMYRWFCPEGGSILDPFAGGSVRGIVASILGHPYTGIDIRQEQVDSNISFASSVPCLTYKPEWIAGDSMRVLDDLYGNKYDMVFTCPPYFDLEVYSDIDGDLSNMNWKRFVLCFREIVRKTCLLLRDGGMAAIVIGDVRGGGGYYRGLVPMCIKAFLDCGMGYHTDAVYCPPPFTAYIRANKYMEFGKLVKTHQNVLVFQKIPQTGTRKNMRSYGYL